ncbi:hypothetical protein WJX84_009025 [Apatococcus fuscideae]|uniref:Fungal lipase-type domain-containing protein n=1 Tax=Apatococcus fuscideae TaxID=2026836 RepID=A0AAW1T0P6_9CHLO
MNYLQPTIPSQAGAFTRKQGTLFASIHVFGTRAWAAQLWTGIRKGDGSSTASDALDKASLVIDTAERAQEVQEVVKESRNTSGKAPPKDISHLLRTTGLMETRYIRQMASMCAQTYYLNKLSAETVFRRYGLRLVTTSRAWEPSSDVHTALTAGQVACDGDGMAATTAATEQSRELLEETAVKAEAPDTMNALTALEKSDKRMSPTDLVASKLAAAFVAAAAAASPLASPFNSLTSSMPVQAMANSLQVAANAGHSTAAATLGMVFAAVESIWSRDKAKHAPPKSKLSSPTEWYVCDDAASQTRFFVLQGSDTVDHWRVNVTFDPIMFEDPELNVKIHRGVYDAAQILYERFLPLVTEHLKRSDSSKIVFTGHSLGGSLATVLMLMYVRRGVLPAQAVSPIYTFGAPAVFCEASACGCTCDVPQPNSLPAPAPVTPCANGAAASSSLTSSAPSIVTACDSSAEAERRGPCSCSADPAKSLGKALPQSTAAAFEATGTEQDGLLASVGVPPSAVRNVLMHKDLVPRAFACDYRLVADLLRRVNESFREHACLSGTGRVVMYGAVGTTLILQPDSAHTFVREPDHPMLPPGPGLYNLRPPSRMTMQVAEAIGTDHQLGSHVAGVALQPSSSVRPGPQLDASSANNVVPLSMQHAQDLGPTGTVKLQRTQRPREKANTPSEALAALMDYPHPLEILADPRSYGPDGAISRYHDPENYTIVLGGVISARTRPFKTLLSIMDDGASAMNNGGHFGTNTLRTSSEIMRHDS